MASFIDVTGLAGFSKIFVFLFVWIVVYALIIYAKILGDNKSVAAIVGLLFALLVLISDTATSTIEFIAPWFGIVFIFFVLVAIAGSMFGGGTDLSAYPALKGVLLVIVVIILVAGALMHLRERTPLPGDNETSSDWNYNETKLIMFHPTILGAILVLLIAVFTVALLAGFQK
jgi:hypothetical protein